MFFYNFISVSIYLLLTSINSDHLDVMFFTTFYKKSDFILLWFILEPRLSFLFLEVLISLYHQRRTLKKYFFNDRFFFVTVHKLYIIDNWKTKVLFSRFLLQSIYLNLTTFHLGKYFFLYFLHFLVCITVV